VEVLPNNITFTGRANSVKEWMMAHLFRRKQMHIIIYSINPTSTVKPALKRTSV
jgi:hypothetical protein